MDKVTTIYVESSALGLKDILTLVALLLGPLLAVWWTLAHEDRKQKRAAKERLFLTLMAHRKSNPPTADWASSLNLIDVVFSDAPAVLTKWHTLYAVLETKPWNNQRYNHAYLEMMSEIAKCLGYKNLAQTDIDKFYAPEVHGTIATRQQEIQEEFLRVLKASKNLAEGNDK